MDNQDQNASMQPAQSISDDQNLAKVLAGINQDTSLNDQYISTPIPPSQAPAPVVTSDQQPTTEPAVAEMPAPAPQITTFNQPAPAPVESNLDNIKKDVLLELRPLVDKLNLSPEEKFDIYLLLIRSTDDKSLIAPAHETAKNITEESKRAQALLDIIKEIDFLSSPTTVQ